MGLPSTDPSSGKNPVQTWKLAKACDNASLILSNPLPFPLPPPPLALTHLFPQGAGQWVGCVAVDEGGDWMVCGGSMAPVIFHFVSNSKITSLPVPANVVTQTAIFANDRVR